MSEIKKYMDIVRLGHKSTADVLHEKDHITITEKLDGANASFVLNEDGTISCFSRNTELSEENNLRGFYNWVHARINPNTLNPNYRYFGEWLVKHKIEYKPEYYNNFYLFNVYDDSKAEYLSDDIMHEESDKLGICTVPLFYDGQYTNFDDLMQYVGKSEMAANKGEGVVVKNVAYRNKYGDQLFVKLVDADFCEIQKEKKPKNPNVPLTVEQKFVTECLTKARVDKMLRKLADENIIPVEFGIENMGIILRNIGSKLFDDIIKEEKDSLPAEYDEKLVKSFIGKQTPSIVKEIINEQNVA